MKERRTKRNFYYVKIILLHFWWKLIKINVTVLRISQLEAGTILQTWVHCMRHSIKLNCWDYPHSKQQTASFNLNFKFVISMRTIKIFTFFYVPLLSSLLVRADKHKGPWDDEVNDRVEDKTCGKYFLLVSEITGLCHLILLVKNIMNILPRPLLLRMWNLWSSKKRETLDSLYLQKGRKGPEAPVLWHDYHFEPPRHNTWLSQITRKRLRHV